MKYGLLLVVILVCFSSCRGNHVVKKVTIQKNKLTLKIDIKNEKQVIDYEHSFDITGMTKQQQNQLVQNIYDSLAVE